MNKFTISEMLELVNNEKPFEWSNFDCKKTSLVSKTKKLASKVKAIAKEMNFNSDEVNVYFSNYKRDGMPMVDCIELDGSGFHVEFDFYNESKYSPSYVSMTLRYWGQKEDTHIECPTWREMKSKLKEYAVEY